MFCGNCGEKIPDESIYCMFCGKPAKPAQPDPKEQPADNMEEWEGLAIWEACRREQQQKQLDIHIEEPHTEPEPKPAPLPEPVLKPDPEPLNEPEPLLEPMVQVTEPMEKEKPALKFCKRCGKQLSENSISEYCLDCLYSPEVLDPEVAEFDPLPAELDAPELDLPEVSIPPRKNRLLIIFLILAAVLAVCASVILLVPKIAKNFDKPNASSQTASQRQDENLKKAVNFAHEMVKAAAFAPESIHFNASTTQSSVEAGDYTVTEQFERQNAQGETVSATYTAILNLGGDKGYTPVMLQVDNAILYDYR